MHTGFPKERHRNERNGQEPPKFIMLNPRGELSVQFLFLGPTHSPAVSFFKPTWPTFKDQNVVTNFFTGITGITNLQSSSRSSNIQDLF